MSLRAPTLWGSSVGKKILMAVTGVILIGFVVAHMVGNLKVYFGPEAFNHYAEGLRTFGAPFLAHGQALWIARIVLILAVVIHITAATLLTLHSRRARPVGYTKYDADLAFSYASHTMVWGGIIILLFVIFHLMHLTWGNVHPDFVKGDAYHNFVRGFQSLPVAFMYMVAMMPLGLHLYHGFWSMLQTLGANNKKYNHLRRPLAAGLALLVTLGNLSFPLAVLSGVLKL
ncbi:MAG: succinate dehydrogenase cytochrome b subunit [Longimicrobiales bacterium]